MGEKFTDVIKRLPKTPGVYKFLGSNKEILYVGKAKNLKNRVSSYFSKTSRGPRIEHMLSRLISIEFSEVRSESEALLLENNLIKTLTPRYNILFRDDKSYPLLKISDHKFPQISFYRGNTGTSDRFFGPYPNAWAVKESIQILQKIFKLRDCRDSIFSNRSRPCIQYQIKRCSAPCVGTISHEDYREDVARAISFLNGNFSEIFEELKVLMENSAKSLMFEKASEYRNQITALSKIVQRNNMESSNGKDCDIFVVASNGLLIAINTATIKGGRYLGDKISFAQNSENAGLNSKEVLAEALTYFLIQYYERKSFPPVIIANSKSAIENLSKWLDLCTKGNSDLKKPKLIFSPKLEQGDWFDLAKQNLNQALMRKTLEAKSLKDRMRYLVRFLGLELTEKKMSTFRIECFDVSHFSGEATYCSCVVFQGLSLQHAKYRKYKIKTAKANDDYGALKEGLYRRFKDAQEVPNLLIIDGGKGQLAIAEEVLCNAGVTSVITIGIAKGDGRKVGLETIFFDANNRDLNQPDQTTLMFLAYIRDEAHRYAILGMRNQRLKTSKKSILDEIEGIGSIRKKRLLARFGGLRELERASIDELGSVNGVSKALASKIYAYIHQ
tara:strand:+ start:337 stop:2175 length:1839 start_codon:yes stop_codon:yes gene_type:complete